MTGITQKQLRVLAIALSSRGFGFVVLEGKETFADWGFKTVKADKNADSLRKVGKLIADYQPDLLVLQDMKGSRRSERIRELNKQLAALAVAHKVRVKLFSREKVMERVFTDGQGTKHALAERLAQQFPEELGDCLPPKRLPWTSEDSRLDIFAAVAMALVFRRQNAK